MKLGGIRLQRPDLLLASNRTCPGYIGFRHCPDCQAD
jgi:hypothetical protein